MLCVVLLLQRRTHFSYVSLSGDYWVQPRCCSLCSLCPHSPHFTFYFPIPNPSTGQGFFFWGIFTYLMWSVTFPLFDFYFWVLWVTRFQGLLGCKVVIFRFNLGICHLGSWEGRRRWYLELMISGFGCLGTCRDGLGCWEW